jgi:hypothetical protein
MSTQAPALLLFYSLGFLSAARPQTDLLGDLDRSLPSFPAFPALTVTDAGL